MKKSKLLLTLKCLIILTLAFSGCKKDEDGTDLEKNPAMKYSARVAISYFDLAVKLTKETAGFTPPVAARAYGYSGVTLYQAVVGGMKQYQSLEGQINGLEVGAMPVLEKNKEYNWEIVANAAMAGVMRELYRGATAENLQVLDELEASNLASYSAGEKQDVIGRSISYGQDVADAMIEYAASDGQDECYLKNFPADYVAPVGDGLWVPTPPAFAKPMQPYWGQVRPFVTENITGTQPPPPTPFSPDASSQFFAEAAEVYVTTTNLTPEQAIIANYWSDDPGKTGTPPGHSISILSQVLVLENADLAVAAEAYAKVGIAVHDAFISCWKCKYDFNLLRPVSYIQQYIAPSWMPMLGTPPFPEYTSGHSVQSGASFQVLTDLFGDNYAFTDHTHEARTDIDGTPRSFNSFFEMADEAAISRLYGGIHYMPAITLGVEQGKKIGQNIAALNFHK